MNTLEIEGRVRAATRAAADTVTPDSVPPLRLPSKHQRRIPGSSRTSAWTPWARWLAPVAAAAAVVAVAVAMVTVSRTVDHRTGGTGPAAAVRPGPVRTGPPISSYVASGGVPRYYVSIESRGNPNFNPSYAVVRATATGAAEETYSPPAGQTVLAVTAAAGDQTFMLDTQPFVGTNSNANQNFEPRTFRELHLSPSGTIMSVSTPSVSVPRGQLMTGFALSPDGSRLAIAVQPDNNKREPDLTEVKVITLATGATQTWTANGTIGIGPDDARSLSWTGDGRTLAFTWAAAGPGGTHRALAARPRHRRGQPAGRQPRGRAADQPGQHRRDGAVPDGIRGLEPVSHGEPQHHRRRSRHADTQPERQPDPAVCDAARVPAGLDHHPGRVDARLRGDRRDQ